MIDVSKLPEEDYFTIQEMAKRWHCSTARIYQMWRDQLIIRLAIRKEDTSLLNSKWNVNVSDICYRFPEQKYSSPFEDGFAVPRKDNIETLPKYLYLIPYGIDETCIYDGGDPDMAEYVESFGIFEDSNGYPLHLVGQELLEDSFGEGPCFVHRAINGPLVITKEERDRFEREQGMLEDENQDKPLSDKERENLLKTIGLMARLIAEEKGNRFKTNDKVNVNQLTEYLLMNIQENIYGMGEKSIRNRISKGLKLLKEQSKEET